MALKLKFKEVLLRRMGVYADAKEIPTKLLDGNVKILLLLRAWVRPLMSTEARILGTTNAATRRAFMYGRTEVSRRAEAGTQVKVGGVLLYVTKEPLSQLRKKL